MNWLFILVLLILVGFGLQGRRVGFIKTVFSIFSIIIALLVSTAVSPVISKALQNNEKIYGSISKNIEKNIKFDNELLSKSQQTEFLDNLKIPKSLVKLLKENNNEEMKNALNSGKNDFKGYVINYLTCLIINAISFIIIFIVLLILLFVISSILNIISKLPIINGLNKTAGLLVGVIQGLIIIWLLCILLTAISGTKSGQAMFEMINQSRFLSSIYDNNLLLKGITDMAKVLF